MRRLVAAARAVASRPERILRFFLYVISEAHDALADARARRLTPQFVAALWRCWDMGAAEGNGGDRMRLLLWAGCLSWSAPWGPELLVCGKLCWTQWSGGVLSPAGAWVGGVRAQQPACCNGRVVVGGWQLDCGEPLVRKLLITCACKWLKQVFGVSTVAVFVNSRAKCRQPCVPVYLLSCPSLVQKAPVPAIWRKQTPTTNRQASAAYMGCTLCMLCYLGGMQAPF